MEPGRPWLKWCPDQGCVPKITGHSQRRKPQKQVGRHQRCNHILHEQDTTRCGDVSVANLHVRVCRGVVKDWRHDQEFDIEIVEMHHNKKIDAPSGTALLLGRAAAAGRQVDLDQRSVRGRDGVTGARRPGDIGFAALRGGTVVGEHTVIFAGPAERVELVHKAEDRMIFARGALKAAQWGKGRKPGLYSMADVLGLGDL